MSKEIGKFKGGLINNSSIFKKGLEISKKAEESFAGKSEEDIWNEAITSDLHKLYESSKKYDDKEDFFKT